MTVVKSISVQMGRFLGKFQKRDFTKHGPKYIFYKDKNNGIYEKANKIIYKKLIEQEIILGLFSQIKESQYFCKKNRTSVLNLKN